jgi:hypothetical protein
MEKMILAHIDYERHFVRENGELEIYFFSNLSEESRNAQQKIIDLVRYDLDSFNIDYEPFSEQYLIVIKNVEEYEINAEGIKFLKTVQPHLIIK